jgi:DNA-nicking Smr family endonuclease
VKARSLQDLRALRDAMAAARRQAVDEAERLRLKRAREQRERDLFAIAVGPVTPLRDRGLAQVARPRPRPEPRQRLRDEQAAVHEAMSDDFDAESLLDTDETLSFRRPDIGPDVVKRLRRGDWAIQAHIDLHGLRREEAREALSAFLRDAVKQRLRCVRVVHGKGHGSPGRQPVLKAKVRAWLVQRQEVIAFAQARGPEGGHGALIVLLRPM